MMHKALFVGVGSIGERHLRCFLQTGRVEAAILEINNPLRQKVAQKYRVTDSYADIETVLKRAFDLAVISTPAQSHIPLATRFAEAGIHLLIEKPLGTSLGEC